MKKQREPYIIYNLRETYAETGRFEFKVVLNPDVFKNGMESWVTLVDADRRSIPLDIKRWGRKINCAFTIDQNVPDGVVTVQLRLKDEGNEKSHVGKASFWVIK